MKQIEETPPMLTIKVNFPMYDKHYRKYLIKKLGL